MAIRVTDTLVPNGKTFPVVSQEHIKGGVHSVETYADLAYIHRNMREQGMLCYVSSEKSLYQLVGSSWQRFTGMFSVKTLEELNYYKDSIADGALAFVSSAGTYYQYDAAHENNDGTTGAWISTSINTGMPIFTEEYVQSVIESEGVQTVSETTLPTEFISIASGISGSAAGTFTPSVPGGYVDIMMKAIRALQEEVARLRNTMLYGLNSYNGLDTAMSSAIDQMTPEEDEPIWAVDEGEGMSALIRLTIGAKTQLYPLTSVIASSSSIAVSSAGATFDISSVTASTNDAKLLVYLHTDNLNFTINLKSTDSNSTGIYVDYPLHLSAYASGASRYNVMVVISRKTSEYGTNYVYVSIADSLTNAILNEGYLNVETNIIRSTYVDVEEAYYIDNIVFENCTIYKCNVYSKFYDFSQQVVGGAPTDENYKYKVAHITIRSVETREELSQVEDFLQLNELIYNEANGYLYIKTADGVKLISGASKETDSSTGEDDYDGMTTSELIELLKDNGIIITQLGNANVELNKIGDITFIHEPTGNSYKFSVNAEGELESRKIPSKTLARRMIDAGFNSSTEIDTTGNANSYYWRGFVGQLGEHEAGISNNATAKTADTKLYADRIKIGAVYAPRPTIKDNKCTHAFVELENTSDKDFSLDNCYLHWITGIPGNNSVDSYTIYNLALEGSIPAGGTFLIRGKQYSDQENAIIKVNTYDMEWYVTTKSGSNQQKQLIDLTVNEANGLLLTYNMPIIDINTTCAKVAASNDANYKKAPIRYAPFFIDGLPLIKEPTHTTATGHTWFSAQTEVPTYTQDCIFRNTFMLDPAKQAYQALNMYDSSRIRLAKKSDYQYLVLDNGDKIKFPKTDEAYDIAKFTPKASFEHRNVCTDKSKLDLNKPNMVTCSFGINMATTRCFNWVSAGYYDEYIWVRQKGTSTWHQFESYKPITAVQTVSENPTTPYRKEFASVSANNNIYARIVNTFPADGTRYTVHKCILIFSEVGTATEYEYVVGRADKTGKLPDYEHASGEGEYTFTLRPSSGEIKLYQTTDQQGFHWVEYQVWAAAANVVDAKITADLAAAAAHEDGSGNPDPINLIPVLINTGDMTQNGTRVNEWYDYYKGGINLFRKYEQMNVVGNNDLCSSVNVLDLGTGDDGDGKTNGYYFHVFYCYEVDEGPYETISTGLVADDVTPIIKNKYIPSLYHFGNNAYEIVMLNTELTEQVCKVWYGMSQSNDAINIYTGWTLPNDSGTTPIFNNTFTTVYTMIWCMLHRAANANPSKKIIVGGHEMPFTVITEDNLKTDKATVCRSLSGTNAGSLVGSHCNRLNYKDKTGIYWLSRLLEYFNVKLMFGGHKHTYACTLPLREYYQYEVEGSTKNSLQHGPMTMPSTLAGENAVRWDNIILKTTTNVNIHSSKFPIATLTLNEVGANGLYYPVTPTANDQYSNYAVTYFMCQATGFKLKSNKELPSPNQRFSYIIPKSTVPTDGSDSTPSNEQLQPMFATIWLHNSSVDNKDYAEIQLFRIKNITNGTKLFTQISYGTGNVILQTLKPLLNASNPDYAGEHTDTHENALFGQWPNGTTTDTTQKIKEIQL